MNISRSKRRKLRDRRVAIRHALCRSADFKSQLPFLVPLPGIDAFTKEAPRSLDLLLEKLQSIESSLALLVSSGCSRKWQVGQHFDATNVGEVSCSLNPNASPFTPMVGQSCVEADALAIVVGSEAAKMICPIAVGGAGSNDACHYLASQAWEPLPFISKGDIPALRIASKRHCLCIDGILDESTQCGLLHATATRVASRAVCFVCGCSVQVRPMEKCSLLEPPVCGACCMELYSDERSVENDVNPAGADEHAKEEKVVDGSTVKNPVKVEIGETGVQVVFLTLSLWRFKTGLTNLCSNCIKHMCEEGGYFSASDNKEYKVAWPRF